MGAYCYINTHLGIIRLLIHKISWNSCRFRAYFSLLSHDITRILGLYIEQSSLVMSLDNMWIDNLLQNTSTHHRNHAVNHSELTKMQCSMHLSFRTCRPTVHHGNPTHWIMYNQSLIKNFIYNLGLSIYQFIYKFI